MPAFLRTALLALSFLAPAFCETTSADPPLLHPLFQDHAVLQRDQPVRVWGWAKPDTKITVSFADQQKQTQAGPDGRWICTLDPLEVSGKGRTLTVETNLSALRAEAHDLLVGDV